MNSLELKFRFIFAIVCVTVFLGSVIWFTFKNNSKNQEYPQVKKPELIDDKIKSIEIYRNSARIIFESGLKRTTPFARNNYYQPYDIELFVKTGDHFLKSADNDTIKVFRGSDSYIFIIQKEINK